MEVWLFPFVITDVALRYYATSFGVCYFSLLRILSWINLGWFFEQLYGDSVYSARIIIVILYSAITKNTLIQAGQQQTVRRLCHELLMMLWLLLRKYFVYVRSVVYLTMVILWIVVTPQHSDCDEWHYGYCVAIRPDIGNNGKEMKGDNKLGIYLSQLHFRYYLGEFCYCRGGPTCLILLLIHVNLVRIFRVGKVKMVKLASW